MLEKLLEQNRKWAAKTQKRNPGFFKELSKQQNPDYLWIGCSDSRVPSNQIIDMPPGTGDVHLSLVQTIPLTGAIIVTTPQDIALADAKRGISMFGMDTINVKVLGLIENMAYFTPAELPDNKYYIFGQEGGKKLAQQMNIPSLGEIPLIQSIREASDAGRPASLQDNTISSKAFDELCDNVLKRLN